MSGEVVRSAHNLSIKRIRSLGARKHRESERVVVLEGVRLLEAALDAGVRPEFILVAESASPEAIAVAGRAVEVARLVDDRVLAAVADTVHSQGVVAVAPQPRWTLPDVDTPLVLVLDHISDPGNLGTMVRTAAAAGVDAIVVSPGSVDPFCSKAMRAGMGAQFIVPLLDGGSADVVSWLRRVCPKRWVADAVGDVEYTAADWSGGVAIVIGSEAHGVSTWGFELATGSVKIPLARQVDSLNAAIAGGVLMFAASGTRRANERAHLE